MSEPFLAEVRMVGFDFPPRGWAFCDGQILPINQNQSLYSLLGTTYGGDGRTSFALPDLRGRTPIHVGRSDGGQEHRLGNKSGEETHTLAASEMPNHRHLAMGSATESTVSSVTTDNANVMGLTGNNIYGPASSALTTLKADTIVHVGGGQAHNNMMPYLAVNFCIAMQGLFPSRN